MADEPSEVLRWLNEHNQLDSKVEQFMAECRDGYEALGKRFDEFADTHQRLLNRIADDWFGPEEDRYRSDKPSYKEKIDELFGAHRDRAAVRRVFIAVLSFFGFTGILQVIVMLWLGLHVVGSAP